MKNLFSLLAFCLIALTVFGQNNKTYIDTYTPDNKNWQQQMKDVCSKCTKNYEYYLNFACYKQKPVSMSLLSSEFIMESTQVIRNSEADTKAGEGSTADILVGGIQPVAWGYHFLKMDPFNPQIRGTNSSAAVFTIRGERLDTPYKDFFYYSQDQKKNFPKYLFFDSESDTDQNSSMYSATTARSISSSSAYEFGVEGGYGEVFECSANLELRKKVDKSKNEKTIITEDRTDQLLGTWKLTDYAVLTRGFVDELSSLPTSYSSSNRSQFESFFNKYGTHYAKETNYGATEVKVHRYTAKEIALAREKSKKIGVEAKANVAKVSVGASFGAELAEANKKENGQETSLTRTVTVGALGANACDEAAPVKVVLREISVLCDAFMDGGSEWSNRKKAINEAIKVLNDESKNSPYTSMEPFITKSDLDAASSSVAPNPNANAITSLIALTEKSKEKVASELKRLKALGFKLLTDSNQNAIDFNEKAGGNYIYLLYKTGETWTPITGLQAVITDSKIESGTKYITDNGVKVIDFNDDAGGKYIYLEYTRDRSQKPIMGLSITSDENSSNLVKNGIGTSANFNKGAGGDTIYLKMLRGK